jgi:hypothetical protein
MQPGSFPTRGQSTVRCDWPGAGQQYANKKTPVVSKERIAILSKVVPDDD